METKLGQICREFPCLFPGELNPDTLPDDFGQFKESGSFLPDQGDDQFGGEMTIDPPPGQIDLRE